MLVYIVLKWTATLIVLSS